MFQTRQHLRYKPIILCVCLFVVFSLFLRYCFPVAFVLFCFFFYKQKPAVTNKEKPEKSLYPAGCALQIPPAKIVTNFSASVHNYIWKVKRFVQGFHWRTIGIFFFFGLFVWIIYLFNPLSTLFQGMLDLSLWQTSFQVYWRRTRPIAILTAAIAKGRLV